MSLIATHKSIPLGRSLLPLPRTILLTHHEPQAEELRSSWGGVPAWIALPDAPTVPIPGVQYTTLGQVGDIVQQGLVQHALLDLPWWQWRPRMLLQLHRLGLRWCWGPWGVASTRLLGYLRGGMILTRRWCNRYHWYPRLQAADCQRWLYQFPATPRQPSLGKRPLRIVHYLRQCALGGTERQVALLAGEQRRCGHDVQAFAQMASLGEQKTCHAWFAEAAVPLRVAGSAWQSQSQLRGKHLRRSFCFLPGELQDTVHDLLRELLPEPPDVLHCWGDEPNLAGLIAARVAGVPAVVQSTTGMSPHSYPATLQPWMQPWYQAGLREPHVALACISEVGRADYAHWLQTPPDRLSLLRIAVEPKEVPTRSAGQAWRREQGIAADAPVLVGLFRLEPGKRPLLFLEIVAQVKKALPALQVLLIGGGSLESQVRQTIQQLGLHDTVRLLGQPADVLTPLAASDLLLLVSEAEGTPVSVLEAQLTGCVPVITDVGGCRETIAPGLTGLVFPKNDVNGIVTALCHLYTNNTLRQRLADAGPAWVRQHFSLERMTKEAEGIYRDLL